MDALQDDMHNDFDDITNNDGNAVQALAEEAEEVGVMHRDTVENIYPEDEHTPTLPTTSEVSDINILPEGRRKRIKPSKYGPDEGYNLTNISEKTEISPDITTVVAFLHVQTAYINAMNTYIEVNTAMQSASEHLALT